MSGSVSATSTTMNSKSEQSLKYTPSLERLLTQDEQRRAALANNWKVTTTTEGRREWNKMKASVERFKAAELPASLEAVLQLEKEEAEKNMEANGPTGDSNLNEVKSPISKSKQESPARISKSLEAKRCKDLGGIETEIKELKQSFENCKKMLVMLFAIGGSLVASYVGSLIYKSVVEFHPPVPSIWNLWGIFS